MLIDDKMNSIEFEINSLQFKSLGLDLTKITKHEKKRDLNIAITKYLESFNQNV